MNKTNFAAMVTVFEQAALLIEHDRCRLAKELITDLDEPTYEKALARYASKVKDYYYYLFRFVFDSFDYKVMYCHKPGLKADLALYREMLHTLPKPGTVSDERKVELADPNILSTPYKPLRTKRKPLPSGPLPLFQ